MSLRGLKVRTLDYERREPRAAAQARLRRSSPCEVLEALFFGFLFWGVLVPVVIFLVLRVLLPDQFENYNDHRRRTIQAVSGNPSVLPQYGDDDLSPWWLSSPGTPPHQPSQGGSYSTASNSASTQISQPIVDTSPHVDVIWPESIPLDGTTSMPMRLVILKFSKSINPSEASASSNYALMRIGPDETPDAQANVPCVLSPSYNSNSCSVALDIKTPANGLLPGAYQLTVYGSNGRGVHDVSGNPLARDFICTFSVLEKRRQN
jgi:hypothetical protein